MKPKTKRQREIVALSATLPPITEKQKQWAFSHCFPQEAYQCKGKAWCSECGNTFDASNSDLSVDLIGDKTICPHCGARLKVKTSQKRKIAEKHYYTIVTTCKGYQVCRNFSVGKHLRKGEKPYYEIHEVVQNWISPDGHEEVVARPTAQISGYYDAWCMNKPMELRPKYRSHDGYSFMTDKYSVSGAWIYPHRRLLPIVKRNGYTGRNDSGIPENKHITLLLTDREAEWLEKTGQYALLKFKYGRGYREGCMPFAHSIRVANRAGYKVKDASMWIDYLGLLGYLGLDTHNAHYVCPRNLKAAHDRLDRRVERIKAEKEAERQRKEAVKWETKYRESKGKYFGICFGDDNITIAVIKSVADIAEEGKEMHHCVYNAGYYKRPDSLILSARDKDGKRLETIEVSLKTFQVVQSRAKCNGTSPQHDRILELVRKNIDLFRKIA